MQRPLPPTRASTALEWRHPLWLAFLVAASVAFSLGFACVTPFAAFATLAALTLGRRDALLLAGAVWLANQAVGFGLLHYPWTIDTLAWGVAIGAATLLATLAARAVAGRGAGAGGDIARFLAAFAAAFVVYEGVLFLVAAMVLGGTEDYTPAIVGEVMLINAGALAGLVVLNRLGRAAGFAAGRDAPLEMARRHA